MHFIGAYDSHHPFVFSAEDQIISDERKIKELVARDLEIDLEILEIPEENATEEIALKQGIIEWCKETWEQDGYQARKLAAEAILECYLNKKEELDLESLKIGSLPESFYLPHLKRLDLGSCDLQSWPMYFNLINLEELDLHNNPLNPESFDAHSQWIGVLSVLNILNNHPNLKKLILDDNGLDVLPENLRFPKLVHLSMDRNWITTLPGNWDIPELQKLFLIGNDLTSLPDNSPYPKLEKLSLEDNPNLEELPISLAYCEQLEEIQSEFLQEAIKRIFTKKKELNYGVKVAQMLGELNGYFDHEGNYDLKLPLEMIGDIAELGTIHGEPGEYWNRAVILAEETELETFDRKENAASSSSLAGSLKRKREEEL